MSGYFNFGGGNETELTKKNNLSARTFNNSLKRCKYDISDENYNEILTNFI